jgi:CO dehydrogenase maturation factor
MVIKSVDIILIISDISLRSIDTAKSIRKSANKFTSYKKIGVIINRVKGDISNILDTLREYDLPLLTLIPEDEILTQFDLEGKAIINIPEDSKSFQEITNNIEKILEI